MLLANDTVRADLMPYPDGSEVKILGWISLRPRKGNTKTALRELRRSYATITAFNVFPQAMSYWRRMQKGGFVDRIFNDEGLEV